VSGCPLLSAGDVGLARSPASALFALLLFDSGVGSLSTSPILGADCTVSRHLYHGVQVGAAAVRAAVQQPRGGAGGGRSAGSNRGALRLRCEFVLLMLVYWFVVGSINKAVHSSTLQYTAVHAPSSPQTPLTQPSHTPPHRAPPTATNQRNRAGSSTSRTPSPAAS